MKLSIIIPVYNEITTLEEIVQRVRTVNLTLDKDGSNHFLKGPVRLEREIVIIDDGSTDGTRTILDRWRGENAADMRIIYHEQNGGKGAALRTGFESATGDILVIQDADLEYDPRDYEKLLIPLLEGRAPVIYGSRFLGGPPFNHEPEPHVGQSTAHLGHQSALWHHSQRHGNLLQMFPQRSHRRDDAA